MSCSIQNGVVNNTFSVPIIVFGLFRSDQQDGRTGWTICFVHVIFMATSTLTASFVLTFCGIFFFSLMGEVFFSVKGIRKKSFLTHKTTLEIDHHVNFRWNECKLIFCIGYLTWFLHGWHVTYLTVESCLLHVMNRWVQTK